MSTVRSSNWANINGDNTKKSNQLKITSFTVIQKRNSIKRTENYGKKVV